MAISISGQLRSLGKTTSRLFHAFQQEVTKWLGEIRQSLDPELGKFWTCLVAAIFSFMLGILLMMSLVALVLEQVYSLAVKAYKIVAKPLKSLMR